MNAKLYFRYGTMGSSKTALALMLAYNYRERGQKPLLAKPAIDDRTDKIWSRIGIEAECIKLEELCEMPYREIAAYDCVIVDEIQFASSENIEFLAELADHLSIPVFTYGLKTDYSGHLFEGSKRMIELADVIEESKTVCWCGRSAKFSALVDENNNIVREGKDSVYIDSKENSRYVSLCRKHYMNGKIQ